MGKIITKTDDKDFFGWDTITSRYWDDEGIKLRSSEITYDDGSAFKMEYSSTGSLAVMTTTDSPLDGGKHDWSSKRIGFTDTGGISYESITYDNGTGESRHFSNGAVYLHSIYDSDYGSETSGESGFHDWKLKSFAYDKKSGKLTETKTLFDDGSLLTKDHEDGLITIHEPNESNGMTISQYDSADIFDWKAKKDSSSEVVSGVNLSATLMDDGDIYLEATGNDTQSYVNIHEDINGSEDYYAKVEYYNAEMDVLTVSYYDSQEELFYSYPEYEYDRPTFDDFNFPDETMSAGIF